MRIPLLSLILTIAAGCAHEPDAMLDGVWQAAFQPVPGVNHTLTLTQHGSAVTGTGTWTGEAINPPGGSLTVSGTASDRHVLLTFTYDNNRTTTYKATLVDATHLAGSETFAGGTDSLVFTKE